MLRHSNTNSSTVPPVRPPAKSYMQAVHTTLTSTQPSYVPLLAPPTLLPPAKAPPTHIFCSLSLSMIRISQSNANRRACFSSTMAPVTYFCGLAQFGAVWRYLLLIIVTVCIVSLQLYSQLKIDNLNNVAPKAIVQMNNCFCTATGEPIDNRVYPKGDWICAGESGLNSTSDSVPSLHQSRWKSNDKSCVIGNQGISSESACEALLRYDEVLFVGDSITRQFYQGLLVVLTQDLQSGSLWKATLATHEQQWENSNWFRWWNPGEEQNNIVPTCQGPVGQFSEGCRLSVIVDTTKVERVCGGRLKMRFWHSWTFEKGFEALLSTVIPNLAPRSLVVTNTGMHTGINPAVMNRWMTRILETAPPGTHVIWHANDPPGAKKSKKYEKSQGREAIHTALLSNMKEIDQLQVTFPQHAIDLIGFWNMTDKANTQCTNDTALQSSDGTHYPLPVNSEKARQLVLLLQDKCAAKKLNERLENE